MLRRLFLLLSLLVASSFPAMADPGFPDAVGAEPAWPDGPPGAFHPIQPGPGDSYYVDGGLGSDTGTGSTGDPLKTIARALELAGAGDTIIVRDGVYHEQVAPADMNPLPSRSLPLVIMAEHPDGQSAVIDGEGVVPVTEGSLQNPAGVSLFHDGVVVVSGFLIRNFTGYGLAIQQSSDAVVRDCTFENNGSEMADSVDLVVISSIAARVLGNSFDSASERAVDDRATDTWIALNHFSSHRNHAVQVGPYPEGTGCRIEHNIFEDNPAIQGVIYINEARGVSVLRNLMIRGNLQGIVLDGAEDTQVLLNTVVGFQEAIEISRLAGCRIEGNIFASNTVGVEILTLMADTGLSANLYWDNTADVDGQGDAGPGAMYQDPGFTNSASDDYSLAPGAFALEQGPADLPVPLGGGGQVDLGAFESGAGEPPWDYQTIGQVADLTPAFVWSYTSRGAGDSQGAFRAQVDSVPSFDSQDLIDSNWIQSAESSWIVPDGFELSEGDWYVRVKTRDAAGAQGPYSDPHLRVNATRPPDCMSLGGTACATLDACDGDWLVADDEPRCCLGSCVACPDADADGFLDEACGGDDCDDNAAAVNPDAEEDCGNGIDDDCDDQTDLDDSACGCVDHDRDGYGENCPAGPDCDDGIASVHPDAEELCNNVDDDCDDETDEGFDLQSDPDNCGECGWACRTEQVCDLGECDSECGPGRSNCNRACLDTSSDLENCGACGARCDLPNAAQRCTEGQCLLVACETGFVDLDGDQTNGCEYACTPDPAGQEICGNGSDDNCDGQVDEECAAGCGCSTSGHPGLALIILLVFLAAITVRPR
ncbi:MAG TPA: MopE-related protein [Myxococcota bacterium]|nr:MopE-related protein [Myxococcota bacterium]